MTDTAPSIVPRLLNHDATAPFALLQWAAVGLAVVVWLDDGAPGVPVGRTTRADGGTGRGRGRRLRSLAALLELGVARVAGRLRGPDARRVQLSVAGVAIAVLLMTTVTGVSLGLASQSAVQSESVDYWVVPEDRSVSTVAVSAGGTRLGDAHAVRSRLAADDRVDYATPVLVQVVSVSNPATGASEYLLLVGVVPPDAGTPSETVAGLSSRALAPGDPHYANGTYDGPWTGDLVLSDAGASLLNASDGAALTARTRGTTRNLTVRNVSRADVTTGLGQAPVGLVHLSELQTLSGAAAGDQADQFLVSTNAAGVASSVESVYPGTSVVTRTGFAVRSMSESGLPLAIAVAALVTALVVGTLYVATIMGLEVTADRRELATLAALGFADRSRTLLVVVQTETVALLGGVLGVGLGYGASHLLNAVAARHLGVASVVRFDPILVAYGVGVALLIGLVAAPYPIYLSRRTDVCAELSR